MFLQRAIAWAVLLLFAGLTVFGLLDNGVLRQNRWEPAGLQRMLIFAGLYTAISAAAICWIPRWYLPLVVGLTFVYTGLAVGFLAPFAIAYLAASCYAACAIWFRSHPEFVQKSPQLPILIGLASWTFFVMATARWPIHYRWIYWLLPAMPIVYALWRRVLPQPQLEYAKTRRDLVPLAAALFPLLCAWLAALKPEVSSDGLAMHMVIPARMAEAHHWAFSVQEFIWAVMPMGGDWAYTLAWMLGGEAAARLLNCAILALIAWTLYERLHARVPGWMCGALVGGFLSSLTQLTGSCSWPPCCWLDSAFARPSEERRDVFFAACAFLAGMAAASLGAWATSSVVRGRSSLVPGTCSGGARAGSGGRIPVLGRGCAQNPFFPMFSVRRSVKRRTSASALLTPLSKTTWYDIHFIQPLCRGWTQWASSFVWFIAW